ncbi:MAG TPA: DUF3899 domain-containing protein [Pseudogracilibacillus sp.]|nr:DUF3899 domain-containing protein [Pseudogracilibacillus sp.]
MSFKYKTLSFFSFILMGSLLFVWTSSSSFSFANWVDKLFMTSLFTTMVGAIMYLLEKSFFDAFIKNFKYFLKKVNKKSKIADEIEQKNYHSTTYTPVQFRSTYPILIAGGSLFMLAIVFSIIQ